MNKTDDQLEIDASRFESWADRCGFLIVFGLAIEFVLAIAYPHGKSWVENWGPVIATAVIAGAVWGEVSLGRKARTLTGEIQIRAKKAVAAANAEAIAARERLAVAEARALSEARLGARDRMRLEFLERAVLPREVPADKLAELVARLGPLAQALPGIGPAHFLNVAYVDRQEPSAFVSSLEEMFRRAGISVRRIRIPPERAIEGVDMYRVDATGDAIAEALWRVARIGGGTVGFVPTNLRDLIPADQNCLIVGENNGAMQPRDGQPGEGIDEHGMPVPQPR